MPKSAAILLSRQPLRPCGLDAWVQKSVEAIRWLKQDNVILYTSAGMQTWEVLTALGSMYGLRQKVYIPCTNAHQFQQLKYSLSEQFELDPDITELLPVWPDYPTIPARAGYVERDKVIVGSAAMLIPISIRPGGQLEGLIEKKQVEGKIVISYFGVDYLPRTTPLAYRVPKDKINTHLGDIADKYLIHWTRTFNSAWPTETLLDYYRTIVESDRYPRSAFDSISNIITTGVIKASTKNMPQKAAVVSFSNRPPDEMIELIRWRARHRQMSFEPYGVGIEKNLAARLEILPVKYYCRDNPPDSQGDTWRTQSIGVITDWRTENEYRHMGDVSLGELPKERMRLFCHSESEADKLTNRFGIEAIPFVRD